MRSRAVVISPLLTILVLGCAMGRSQTLPNGPAAMRAEVVGNIRAQPLGADTVAVLALPDAFLDRVADRIIRNSFENQLRIVVDDGSGNHAG